MSTTESAPSDQDRIRERWIRAAEYEHNPDEHVLANPEDPDRQWIMTSDPRGVRQ